MCAIALEKAGDAAQGQRLTEELSKRFPEDTIVQVSYLPTARAASALKRGDPDSAIQTLTVAAPYELGITTQNLNFSLYPIYLRGEALIEAHQGAAAAAEFQKITSHPGLVANQVTGALTHLQFGRAYAMSGETAKAKNAYQDFLALWKDADPDIPILKQAKAEYAKLP